ncbi:unnamed protein product, partial [Nesidiocoris tenuis]
MDYQQQALLEDTNTKGYDLRGIRRREGSNVGDKDPPTRRKNKRIERTDRFSTVLSREAGDQ